MDKEQKAKGMNPANTLIFSLPLVQDYITVSGFNDNSHVGQITHPFVLWFE